VTSRRSRATRSQAVRGRAAAAGQPPHAAYVPSPTETTSWSSTWTTCWASRRWAPRVGAGRMRRWSRAARSRRAVCRRSRRAVHHEIIVPFVRSPQTRPQSSAAATAGPAATALGRAGGQCGQCGHFGRPAVPARLGMAVLKLYRHRERGSGAAADRHRAAVGPHGSGADQWFFHRYGDPELAPAAPDPRRARPAAARRRCLC